MVSVDREKLLAKLGGPEGTSTLSSEAKADALEDFLADELNQARYPTAAEIEAQIETRAYRRGVGSLFFSTSGNVKRLQPMPARPTLADYFRLRFQEQANHVLQSANLAQKNGMSEEVILACLLHDTVQALVRVNHGWYGAQLYEPYVSEKVAFAIRYHQALRFFEDKDFGYEYPDLYRRVFGEDYQPEAYIVETYKMVRQHEWYKESRLVTVNDLYSFEKDVNPGLEQFTDIIARNFKQPKEGLGFDNSASAHMWRSIAMPDCPL